MERLKTEGFIFRPYSIDEANRLLEVVKGKKLELVIALTLFYGLRHNEVLGLRWNAINFERETIVINHSLNQAFIDGKYTVLPQDKLKRTASFRTMPLIQQIKELLSKGQGNPRSQRERLHLHRRKE